MYGVKLSPIARASSSAAYSDCVGSCVSEKYYAASRLLRSATWCALNLGGLCLFSLFYWFSAEKVCLWAVPLFTGNEKKRKLKQPLNNLNFGLPLSGGTSRSLRLLIRHLKGLFTELIGFLKTLHWSHFSRSQRPFHTLFPQRKITSHFSTAGTSRLAHLAGQTKELFQLSFFKSHFCSAFSLGFNNTRETLVEI